MPMAEPRKGFRHLFFVGGVLLAPASKQHTSKRVLIFFTGKQSLQWRKATNHYLLNNGRLPRRDAPRNDLFYMICSGYTPLQKVIK